MKNKVLLALIYFVVLLILAGLYVRDSRKKIEHVIHVESSPWLSTQQNNQVSVQTNHHVNYGNQSIYIAWENQRLFKYENHAQISSTGKGVFQIPEVPKLEKCEDLRVSWLNVGENAGVGYHELDKLQRYTRASARVYCKKFGVDDTSVGAGSKRTWFHDGQYAPRTELAVYPLSEFIPGKANEVLFVDIKDGVPYQGNIIVEQLNAPPGTNPQIGVANASGVTSLDFTLDGPADFRITAGSDVLNVPFRMKPNGFHVAADDYLILMNHELPSVRITPAGPPEDFIIDYFVGYAWIQRQIVPAHQLNQAIRIQPEYQFYKDEPEIVYAKIYPANGGESQIIPFVAKVSQPGYDEWKEEQEAQRQGSEDAAKIRDAYTQIHTQLNHLTAANLEFSAIFEDYVKLKMLNGIDLSENLMTWHNFSYYNLHKEIWEISRKSERQRQYGIFVAASVLNELLSKDWNNDWADNLEVLQVQRAQTPCEYSDECNQIRKYLLHFLSSVHHIELKEMASSLKQEQAAFEANKRKEMRHSMMMVAGWFAIGIVCFGAAARRIRNRRQTEYFEAAARGKKQGMIPGAPLWLKVVVCALCFGLLASFYRIMSLL